MTPARKRAEQAFGKTVRPSTETRDIAFFAQRRAKTAANLERTLELRTLRLAHEAANPAPKVAPRRRLQPSK